jgi:hypothetical protein
MNCKNTWILFSQFFEEFLSELTTSIGFDFFSSHVTSHVTNATIRRKIFLDDRLVFDFSNAISNFPTMIVKRNVMNRMNNCDDVTNWRDDQILKDSCDHVRSGDLLSSKDQPIRLRGVEESDHRVQQLAVCGAHGFLRHHSCVETLVARYGGREVGVVVTTNIARAMVKEEGNVVQRVEVPHLFRLDEVSGLVHPGKSRQEEEELFFVSLKDFRNRLEGIHQSRPRNWSRYHVSD